MKLKRAKISTLLFMMLVMCCCGKDYLSYELVKNYERDLNIDKIYKDHTLIVDQSFISLKENNLISQDKDIPKHLIDTNNTKKFKFDLEYFCKESRIDSVWSKTTLEIEFGEMRVDSTRYWFPIRGKKIGYSRNKSISSDIDIHFTFLFYNKDMLDIHIDIGFILMGEGGYSKTIKKDGTTISTSKGPVTTDGLIMIWRSRSGGPELLQIKENHKAVSKPLNTTMELSELKKDSLEDRIVKLIFNTNKQLSRRLKANSN